MKQLFAVAKTEFKTRLRGLFILFIFISLIYWLASFIVQVCMLEPVKEMVKSGEKAFFVYDSIMQNSFHAVKYSFLITIFCFNILHRDRRSTDMDIYCSTNAGVGGYYFGKFLGNFLFFFITTFIISILEALLQFVLVFLKLMPPYDFHGLSVMDLVLAFPIAYFIMVIPIILYGIILPLTISNFVKRQFVLVICAVIEIPAVFLPINKLSEYLYWQYDSVAYHSLIKYPKFILKKSNYFRAGEDWTSYYTAGQVWLSVIIIASIALALFILGYLKFRHDMLRKELK